MNRYKYIWLGLLAFGLLFVTQSAQGASFYLSPPTGSFQVGSTFDVSIFLDTEGEYVNAIDISLSFPADKLQLVSPSGGKSIVEIWTQQPKVDNQSGKATFQGGIPGGLNVSRGLITTLSFRVRTVGNGTLKFLDDSKILANDGKGTDILDNVQNAVYTFILPPPAGPVVSSPTHPDQSAWYTNQSPTFIWALDERADAYSYILDSEPVTIPDNISEGSKTSTSYDNVPNNRNFFHIKALRDGIWGGVTHFAVKIDSQSPAEFPIEISPGTRSTRRQPVITFGTTDGLSGVARYEIKIISRTDLAGIGASPLFIEATSPYVPPELELGSYDVIVQAYDLAGNVRVEKQDLRIVTTVFGFVQGRGFEIKNFIVIPWFAVWLILGLLLALIVFIAWRVRRWHHGIIDRASNAPLPAHVSTKLAELRKYQQKYGKIAVALFVIVMTLASCTPVQAVEPKVSPPLITTVSREIFNDEIFYIGGNSNVPKGSVTIYLQDINNGQILSQETPIDEQGGWFYRHPAFLSTGNYLLWVQTKAGDVVSAPSSQVQLTVRAQALQLGSSRISYETIYLTIIIVLMLAIVAGLVLTMYHYRHGKRKHAKLAEEIRRAEESVRRGFAVIKRDIEAEFAVVKRAKMSKDLSENERIREEQLVRDLEAVQKHIGQEIWEIEELEKAR